MKIIISGYGKMGRELEKELTSHDLIVVSPEKNISFKDIEEDVDLIIDFSFRNVIYDISYYLSKHKNAKLIIGTTSYLEDELKLIEEISKEHVVIKSSNFSKGINILFSLLDQLKEYDLTNEKIYLLEKHHKEKKDSPSGTSKAILEKINKPIQVECIKNGDIIGEHKLDIYFENELLSISHVAYSRNIFVKGVLKAIENIKYLNNGLYFLEDLSLWKEKK